MCNWFPTTYLTNTWIEKSSLPQGAKPLVLCLYADKSKLSSFGTKKGYPVIARCANLPVKMRNGIGLGGGRVVGWLPVVGYGIWYIYLSDDFFKVEGNKVDANFKRVVWHKSFLKLLESIHKLSKIGFKIQCADGVVRHVYLAILILSADYEEQYG